MDKRGIGTGSAQEEWLGILELIKSFAESKISHCLRIFNGFLASKEDFATTEAIALVLMREEGELSWKSA